MWRLPLNFEVIFECMTGRQSFSSVLKFESSTPLTAAVVAAPIRKLCPE